MSYLSHAGRQLCLFAYLMAFYAPCCGHAWALQTSIIRKSRHPVRCSKTEMVSGRARMPFAAQTFAERLFALLQRGGGERFETRLAITTLVSRVVGVHRLLLLNFYPFLRKYLQPHQRDVTQLLAALVQVGAHMQGHGFPTNIGFFAHPPWSDVVHAATSWLVIASRQAVLSILRSTVSIVRTSLWRATPPLLLLCAGPLGNLFGNTSTMVLVDIEAC